MAYQTGTASDVLDLIDKLRVFALAQGWTVDEWASPDLHISKGGRYFVLRGDTSAGSGADLGPFIYICGATGYAAGSAWNAQPGTSPAVKTNRLPGPFAAYHFFAGSGAPDYLHVVVEVSAGVYKHFHVGSLDPFGSIADGSYASGSAWRYDQNGYTNYPEGDYHTYPFDGRGGDQNAFVPTVVRVDTDGTSPKWNRFDRDWTAGHRAIGMVRSNVSWSGMSNNQQHPSEELWTRNPNTFNAQTILLPMPVFVERASNLWSPAGFVKDLRYVNVLNLTPGELLTIGSDEWLVFPCHQKTSTWDTYGSAIPSSGRFGLAYKKIP